MKSKTLVGLLVAGAMTASLGFFMLKKSENCITPPKYIANVIPEETRHLGGIGLAAADFDGDGTVDLATVVLSDNQTSNSEKEYVFLYKKNAGKFIPYDVISEVPSDTKKTGGIALAAADVDNDGDVDLLTTTNMRDRGVVHLYENDGRGNYVLKGDFAKIPPDVIAEGDIGLAAADIDNDGDIDLLTTANYKDKGLVSLLRNDGRGNFSLEMNFLKGRVAYDYSQSNVLLSESFYVGHGGVGLAAADYDGDGDVDVFVTTNLSDKGRVRLYENKGDNKFILRRR